MFNHKLVAGMTGSGKSNYLDVFITNLLKKNPETTELVLIDPKKVEFDKYKEVKHLKYPVATESDKAIELLEKIVDVMQSRLEQMKALKINDYKEANFSEIYVIIDEYADLKITLKSRFENIISRLVQKARATGIKLVLATQKPSNNMMSNDIKAQIDFRVCLRVSEAGHSRIILGSNGGEKLEIGEALIKIQKEIKTTKIPYMDNVSDLIQKSIDKYGKSDFSNQDNWIVKFAKDKQEWKILDDDNLEDISNVFDKIKMKGIE